MSVYTKEQQTRTITNKETGESKTFKSTGVDSKGKHFFTSSDSAKIEKFLSGKNPSIKTGLPVGKTSKGALGVLTGRRGKRNVRGDITKKMKTGGVENNNKIVRASDNNPIKRFVKKHFGTTYLQEMTDKELQAVADKPDSVFGKLKRLGQVAGERDRRLINLDKSYKDKVIRDHSKMLKELERRKKPRKKMGGTMVKKAMGGVMKNRGGAFKGTF